METNGISIETIGVLRVFVDDGANLTPPGARPRALLAAIALSPRKTAGRRWLEALLWGDRTADQASGSLRQALRSLRKALGPFSGLLHADRQDVSLDADLVRVDLIDSPGAALQKVAAGRGLLEGIDIRSEPFEDWLRQERTALERLAETRGGRAASPSGAPGLLRPDGGAADAPILIAETKNSGDGLDAFIAESISAQLGRTATEHIRTEVIMVDGGKASAVLVPGVRCTIRTVMNGDRMMALVNLVETPSHRHVWSRQVAFDARDELVAVDIAASLAFEATEAVASVQADAGDAARANAMAASALQDVFSFDPERLKKADSLLADAHLLDPLAPRPALRALAKAFLAVERSVDDAGELRVEARELVGEALVSDPNNSLALAFIADVHDLVFEDRQKALSFAEQALRIDPGVGYAHASLGGLELRRGRAKEALQSASRARRQLENTSLQVFALMRFCLAAISAGEFAAAAEAAAKAAVLAPLSRPPLRHLYTLQLQAGDDDGARETLRRLHRFEGDFSLARIRNDPEFPAATIRSAGLHLLRDVEY